MLIVKKEREENMSHANNCFDGSTQVPDGWAVVPEELEQKTLSLLPWVTITWIEDVVSSVIDNVEARQAWESRPQPTPEPTAEEDRDAMLIDLMADVALLKLGIYE